jgi:hypothetical protein
MGRDVAFIIGSVDERGVEKANSSAQAESMSLCLAKGHGRYEVGKDGLERAGRGTISCYACIDPRCA